MPTFRFRLTWTDGTGAPQSKLVQADAVDPTQAAAEIARRNAALAAAPGFRIEALDQAGRPAAAARPRVPTGKSGPRKKARPARSPVPKRGKSRKAGNTGQKPPATNRTRRAKTAGQRKTRGWGDPIIIRSGIVMLALVALFFIAQPLISPALHYLTQPEPLGPPIVYTGDSGRLEFRMRGQDSFAFNMTTQGASASLRANQPAGSCQALGEAVRSDDRYIYQDSTCRIIFAFAPDGVAVTAGRCSAFCGNNATLSGSFGP